MNKFLNNILNIQTAFAQPFAQQSATNNSSVASETGNQVANLVDTIIKSIPYWITGFIVIVLSLVLAKVVKSMVENRMTEAGLEEEHKEIQIVASRAASASVMLIGITAGLKIAGLDLTSIIAAAAFGVGFAMKDLIMNFISGIIVLLQKQFTIGDWITVKGTTGIIQEIQSRYTVIKKFDGTKVIVPNAELFKNQITSLTSNPTRRFQVDLNIDLYMDLKEVIDQLYVSIAKCDRILQNPKPSILVRQPGPGHNSLRLRCWVESKKGVLKATSALIRQIHKDFYKRGWSWTLPTEKIVFDKDVHPDINERSQAYIEKHKKAAKEEKGLIEQQKEILAQQEKNIGTPAQPVPQAQQVGVGGPAMEAPVWLQQAAGQNPEPQSTNQPQVMMPEAGAPQSLQNPPVTNQPGLTSNQQGQADQNQSANIPQNLQTIGIQQPATIQILNPQYLPDSAQPEEQVQQQPVMAQPIVAAPDVQNPQAATPAVSMPLPDVINPEE